jgi:hypothetical protein
MSLPPGFKTLLTPRSASTTPGIVHRAQVLTTVSTVPSSSGVVMREVDAGTHADLEDHPLSQRDHSLPDFLEGLRIAQQAYEMGVDAISIEGHGLLGVALTS